MENVPNVQQLRYQAKGRETVPMQFANDLSRVLNEYAGKVDRPNGQELDKAREEGVKMGMENAWGIVSALLDTLDVDKNEEEIRILTGINQLFDTEITKLALKLKDNK